MNKSESVDILLIEDNPVDAILIKHTLKDTDLNFRLHHVEDGEAAVKFIQRNCYDDIFPPSLCPDLIILDLNLPKKSGKEVLGEIKQHPATLNIPVVVLSTSGEDKEICEAYSLHANCYAKKPTKYAEFEAAVKFIQQFWTNVVELPNKS
jgi:two-component system, chemotaxis family, response regulator Rcp1